MPSLHIYNPDGTAQTVSSIGPRWTRGELQFWMGDDEDCPAMGTGGVHSDDYYEGGRCLSTWGKYEQ